MKVLLSLITACLFSMNVYAMNATHGMVIFGKEKLFASHMPMYHAPHDKQVVFTFEVEQSVKDQIISNQDKTYLTFVPAPFDLNKFVATPFEITGDLYQGHFEKDGVLFLSGVTLKNPKIEFLNENLKVLSGQKTYSSYKIFGTKNDTYALFFNDGHGLNVDEIFKLTTVSITDFDFVTKYHYIFSAEVTASLIIGNDYSISTPPGRCPSRLCGEPGYELAQFKVDALYFNDSLM
ncbi:MAG: hypothetical protein H7177_03645 [Rhizobacter sp.]|nr:hypothetical protein [Bacteriovorax sp.]